MTDKNMNKKMKNLTITELKKKNKELDEVVEHVVEVGGDSYKIKVDKVFRQTKQHAVIDDLVDFFNEGNNNLEILDLATPYVTLLLIKHFTSLEVPNDIDEALDVLNVLIDLELFGEILEIMPEQEVTKMYEILTATVSRMNSNIIDMQEEARKISEQIENAELKEMVEENGIE